MNGSRIRLARFRTVTTILTLFLFYEINNEDQSVVSVSVANSWTTTPVISSSSSQPLAAVPAGLQSPSLQPSQHQRYALNCPFQDNALQWLQKFLLRTTLFSPQHEHAEIFSLVHCDLIFVDVLHLTKINLAIYFLLKSSLFKLSSVIKYLFADHYITHNRYIITKSLQERIIIPGADPNPEIHFFKNTKICKC